MARKNNSTNATTTTATAKKSPAKKPANKKSTPKAAPKAAPTIDVKIANLPNKGKVNWGAIKATDGYKVAVIFNALRKNTYQLKEEQANEKSGFLMQYPGKFVKGPEKGAKQVYICDDKKKQTEFNEKFDQLQNRHREATKKDTENYKALFATVFPQGFYNSYLAFANGQVDKNAFRENCFKFLQNGLGVPFGKKGLDDFTNRVCDAVGVKLTSDKKFAQTDDDIEAYNEIAFGKLVMGVVRQQLIDKNVIERDPLAPKEEASETEVDSAALTMMEQVIRGANKKNGKVLIDENLTAAEILNNIPVTA